MTALVRRLSTRLNVAEERRLQENAKGCRRAPRPHPVFSVARRGQEVAEVRVVAQQGQVGPQEHMPQRDSWAVDLRRTRWYLLVQRLL